MLQLKVLNQFNSLLYRLKEGQELGAEFQLPVRRLDLLDFVQVGCQRVKVALEDIKDVKCHLGQLPCPMVEVGPLSLWLPLRLSDQASITDKHFAGVA